jgi:spore maturation protein CgeB
MRLHNPDSHNMRSFEIPAVGGIQLAPDTPDHREYFQEGKEIFLFRDTEDCVTRIRQLLAFSSAEALKIRQQARKRCLDSGYSYEARSEFLASLLLCFFPKTGL